MSENRYNSNYVVLKCAITNLQAISNLLFSEAMLQAYSQMTPLERDQLDRARKEIETLTESLEREPTA